MDDDGVVQDVFAINGLWKPSAFFEDIAANESSLFPPLQFDGMAKRVHASSLADRVQFLLSSSATRMPLKHPLITNSACQT